jgi:hypothetical protein
MAINRTPPLDERVKNIRADLDAFIDAHVAEIKKTCPGVPDGVIRNSLTRGMGCQCATYLEIKRQDDAARESAA